MKRNNSWTKNNTVTAQEGSKYSRGNVFVVFCIVHDKIMWGVQVLKSKFQFRVKFPLKFKQQVKG